MKPENLTYTGTFIKEGTWRTEQIGASFSYTLNCKYGNETIVFNLKRMSKGGLLDLYYDGKKLGEYSCYSKSANTQAITLTKTAGKGKHTIKAVFKGKKSDVDYKKSEACMYVGTAKATVINSTSKLNGKDLYSTYVEYKSPNYSILGHREAPDIFDEQETEYDKIKERLKTELKDEPDIELDINYIGNEDIGERDAIWFIHEIMGYDTDLKVISLNKTHPLNPEADEIGFSNNKKDILKISNILNNKIKNVNAALSKTKINNIHTDSSSYNEGSIVGSVLIDE